MKFTKMHGIGNDYIYINGFEEKVENIEKLSILLSDRHKGIGGDGIILINPSKVADLQMRIFNADGSEAKMCGNGIRCVAKYGYERKLVNKKVITIETLSGIKTIMLNVENEKVVTVTVDMGEPILNPKDIPMNYDGETFINKQITVMDKLYYGTAVSMGNPHFVVFIKDVKNLELDKIGSHFENNYIFPQRVNTEFAEITENGIYMRVWERGSGETMACGTGASAVLTAAVLNKLSPRKNTIMLLGGNLEIEWREDNHVYMTGPAEFVFDGVVDQFQLDKIK